MHKPRVHHTNGTPGTADPRGTRQRQTPPDNVQINLQPPSDGCVLGQSTAAGYDPRTGTQRHVDIDQPYYYAQYSRAQSRAKVRREIWFGERVRGQIALTSSCFMVATSSPRWSLLLRHSPRWSTRVLERVFSSPLHLHRHRYCSNKHTQKDTEFPEFPKIQGYQGSKHTSTSTKELCSSACGRACPRAPPPPLPSVPLATHYQSP